MVVELFGIYELSIVRLSELFVELRTKILMNLRVVRLKMVVNYGSRTIRNI